MLDRPSIPALVVALVAIAAGWAHHVWAGRPLPSPDPGPIGAGGDRRPRPLDGGGTESPAVVALLTNGFEVPPSAITATVLDLAARGWVRITVVDDEFAVITRGSGAAGDVLQAYEQQVLGHLAARAFNDVSSAGTLAVSQYRLDRRWRQRFSAAVAGHAQALGLSTARHGATTLGPAAAAVALAAIALTVAFTRGSQVAVADSWRPRAVALAVFAATVALAWHTYVRAASAHQRPTELGTTRAVAWMRYRHRLRQRIPPEADVLVGPSQLTALAYACVMGVTEQVHEQLPVAPESPRAAWSEAGGTPHRVAVRYPFRPGYGQHPVKVAVVGAVVLAAAWWVRGFLQRVADGKALISLLERVPGQIDLIETIATVLAGVCWLPIAWAAWSVLAGVVDTIATRERVGLVIRTRRPLDVIGWASAVNPLAERQRDSTYVALDDGRRTTVTAWLASDRTAAPQGAQARVRATPLLGFVRSSEPVGTAARMPASSPR